MAKKKSPAAKGAARATGKGAAAREPQARMIYAGVCAAAVVALLAAAVARDGRAWEALAPLLSGGGAAEHQRGGRAAGRDARMSEMSTPTASSPVPADRERHAAAAADDASCADYEEHCAAWREMGECEKNPEFMHARCPRACDVCHTHAAAPEPEDGGDDAPWGKAAREARRRANPKCKDKAAECPFWAKTGECDANPRYMQIHCALSCATCDWADFGKRCKKDPDLPLALGAGDMQKTFERIEHDPAVAPLQPRVLSRDPWVVVFDSFLSDAEAQAILDVARREGEKHFTPSQGTGKMDEEGTLIPTQSDYRTSWTNWCEDDCLNTTAVKVLRDRAESVTGVPDANHEFPQFLRYDISQYYRAHNDYIPAHREMPCGARVLTLFLYLTDVEEGGQTSFPRLGLQVQPKRGRAVLWPSVLDELPEDCDERTEHIAEPVTRGMKYSINLWLHQHDFKKNNKIGCTG